MIKDGENHVTKHPSRSLEARIRCLTIIIVIVFIEDHLGHCGKQLRIDWGRDHFGVEVWDHFEGYTVLTVSFRRLSLQNVVSLTGIRNIKIYAREIVGAPGTKTDVSAPNWDQRFETGVQTGRNGENGNNGEPGPQGE